MTTATDAVEFLAELVSHFSTPTPLSPSRPNASTLSKPKSTGCELARPSHRRGRVSGRLFGVLVAPARRRPGGVEARSDMICAQSPDRGRL